MATGLYETNIPNDPEKGINVTQYGWDGNEIDGVTLIQDYIAQAQAILDAVRIVEGNIQHIINDAQFVKEAYDYIVIAYEDILVKYPQIQAYVIQMQEMLEQATQQAANSATSASESAASAAGALNTLHSVQVIAETISITYADILVKYAEINTAHADVIRLTNESKAIVEELRKGQVYRGVWNPNTTSWPNSSGTNSVWDVVLNAGQSEFTWNNIKWLPGDRLLYLKDTSSYIQIESGVGVLSVNGKAGFVTLVPSDIGANTVGEVDSKLSTKLSLSGGTMLGPVNFGESSKYVTGSGQDLHVAAKAGSVYLDGKTSPIARVNNNDYTLYHQGFKPTSQDVGATPLYRWEAKIKLGSWSAICQFNHTMGYAGKAVLTVGMTRSNFVTNSRFLISWGHPGVACITQLEGHGYAQIQVRVGSTPGDNCIFSILDTNYEGNPEGSEVLYACQVDELFGEIQPFTQYTSDIGISDVKETVATEYRAIKIGNNKVYHQGFKPTAADVGAVPLTGGVMSGVLESPLQAQFKGLISNTVDANGLALTSAGQWGCYSAINIASTNMFPFINNANGMLNFNTHEGQYYQQIGLSSNGNIYHRSANQGAWTPWNRLLKDTDISGGSFKWADLVNKIPYIDSFGGSDLGRYVDMHETNSDIDFNWRWDAGDLNTNSLSLFNASGNLVTTFNSNGTLSVPSGTVSSSRCELVAASNPMVEWHIPGQHATISYLDSSGHWRFANSNGGGGAQGDRFTSLLDGSFSTLGPVISNHTGNSFWAQLDTAPFRVNQLVTFDVGIYSKMISQKLHNSGSYIMENSLGSYAEEDTWDKLSHTLVSTDGGSVTAIWKIRNDGAITPPTSSWSMPNDGNLVSSRWGGDGIWDACVRTFSPASDENLKVVIGDSVKPALDVVDKFKFKQFVWKENSGKIYTNRDKKVTEIGLIAQQVEEVDPTLVKTVTTYNSKEGDITELKTLDTANLLALAFKSIQELRKEVETLKAEICKQ